MFDPKQLLDQVLGSAAAGNARAAGRDVVDRLDSTKGSQAFAGGAVAGGLLGLFLGGGRRHGGGLLGYGGAAALGALALRAYQNYQIKQGATLPPGDFAPAAMPHASPAADGTPFELVLVRAMVGAAKADGHIDEAEQRRLFAEVERLGLDAEAKAYIFDLLREEIDLYDLATAATTAEQRAEIYLAARLAIDVDEPAERAYLDALAARLGLPAELRATLDGTQKK
jgi:uncharacterized membrane protein YebE (DUF533 family)